MSSLAQIRQIHTLKNILGLDDDLYREMLSSFGVYSSKNLTQTEAALFISILNDKVKYTKINCNKKYDDLYGRDSEMATPPQMRKIEVLWKYVTKIKDPAKQKAGLRKFIKNKFKVDDIRFMSKSKASRVIAVLEKIKLNKELKAI